MSRFTRRGELFLPGDSPASFVYISASAISSIGAATTSDGEVYVFDAATAQFVSNFRAHEATINGIDFNDCSKLLATCCDEGRGTTGNEVSLWDLRSPVTAPVCTFGAACYVPYATCCRTVATNRDGAIVGAGTDAGVLCWDVRKPEAMFRHVNQQPDEVASLKFHPFGSGVFLAGDDDGNLLLYDLDATEENAVMFYMNDGNPVFQCGFCGTTGVFTLWRTAGIRLWDVLDSKYDAVYQDLREKADNSFGYPVDAHWCGEWLMMVGGDSEGGVAVVLCSETDAKLFEKIEHAHKDCVNASHLDVLENGEIHLYLAGDGGQLSFWSTEKQE